jgi:branched-chain amino acid aminotransferase
MEDYQMEHQAKKELEVFVNDRFVPESQAAVSVFDHGLLYGDGVYDTLCGWNGYIFRLQQHVDRLYMSSHAVKIDIPFAKEELMEKIVETASRTGHKNLYLKCYVTRGVGPQPLLDPRNCKPTVVIFGKPYLWLIDPKKNELGLTAKITCIRRTPDQCIDGKVKNLNYLNIVLAKIEAIESGMDEAIMPGLDGQILEGPGYNVFIVNNEEVITPPPGNILMGVTRSACLDIAKELGLEIGEKMLSAYDLYNADEVFLSSTAGGVVAIRKIDGRTIGSGQPGPITKKIYETYFHWLEIGKDGTKFQ